MFSFNEKYMVNFKWNFTPEFQKTPSCLRGVGHTTSLLRSVLILNIGNLTCFNTGMAMRHLSWLIFFGVWTVTSSLELDTCEKRIYLAKAEQMDANGRKCWDTVKVPCCGGRCSSREVIFFYMHTQSVLCTYSLYCLCLKISDPLTGLLLLRAIL